MNEVNLKQRLDWLEHGLSEIGKLCLRLAGVSPDVQSLTPNQLAAGPAPVAGPATTLPPVSGDVSLGQFLQGVQDLSPQDRLVVADAAIAMLGQVFVHLPLKRAMHGIDPLQRLRLLRLRITSQLEAGEADNGARSFHDEMIDIFHSLRDLHTNYILPSGYQGRTAYLPFLVEEFYEGMPRKRRYLVTRTIPGFSHPTFQPGVTITHWNGVPIDRAIERNAAREAGSNPDARHARGLEALTLRPMGLTAPPDEEWVIIGYESGGSAMELRFSWRVMVPAPSAMGLDIDDPTATADEGAMLMGYDAATVATSRAKKALFFPNEMGKEQRMAQALAGAAGGADSASAAASPASHLGFDAKGEALRHVRAAFRHSDVAHAERNLNAAAAAVSASGAAEPPQTTSLMPNFFAFRPVTTPVGVFGYIRIYTFMTNNPNGFVAEFVRIAKLLPQNGLIVDVRGNGGGHINAGEQLLQVLTNEPIEPERFHFINTESTLRLCTGNAFLKSWVDSIALAVQTGEIYSQGFPLTPLEQANAGLAYRYPGKVVLIIDALCYSTTDIFAAGFQDHEIGKIVGTSRRTGAGGANVWTYGNFGGLPGFGSLPQGVNFRTATRRSTRVKARAGVPLEDLGVTADFIHQMTREDILDGNADLINASAQFLGP